MHILTSFTAYFTLFHQGRFVFVSKNIFLVKIIIIGRVKGRSGLVIQDCRCDQEGRKLSWETRAEEVGFEVLPKRCNTGTVSYMKGERVPKDRGIVTEGIREVFD